MTIPNIDAIAGIAAAFFSRNDVAISDIPAVIQAIAGSLNVEPEQKPETFAKAEEVAVAPAEVSKVPIEKSVTDEKIYCLECGQGSFMLRRHLTAAHGMTPGGYKLKWSLPDDYPMVAPNYSKVRSDLAKATGLGKR